MTYELMTDAQLTELVRSVAKAVETGPGQLEAKVKPLRDAGITAGPYRGEAAKVSPRNTVLWFAGELLDCVDNNSLFAINSWLNCVDKFVPAQDS